MTLKFVITKTEDIPSFASFEDENEFWLTHQLSDKLMAALRTYPEDVQAAIDKLVAFGEEAEASNLHALSGWYGSLCKWVREREKEYKPFTLTLPEPTTGGDPLTIIEVKVTL